MADKLDRAILRILQDDGRATHATIGDAVGLSVSSVNERVRKLRADGVIKATRAVVDGDRVGLPVTMFVQVLILGADDDANFAERVSDVPGVQEVHQVSGEYGFLLKIRCASVESAHRLIQTRVMNQPGVVRCNSLMSFQTVKESTALDL